MPRLEQERLELERQVEKGPPDERVIDKFVRMGDDMNRLVELRQIAGEQFFTDSEEVAREFAGPEGFVIVVDVPSEIASEHHKGEQIMSPGEQFVVNSNFVFSASELIEHSDDWDLDTIDIASEREEQNREKAKAENKGETRQLLDHTIREEKDLSEADKEAVKQLRQQFGSMSKPR